MQSYITRSHLVALPFSDHCPLLTEDDESANNLLDQAVQLAQQKRVRYLELRTGVNDVLKKRKDFGAYDFYAKPGCHQGRPISIQYTRSTFLPWSPRTLLLKQSFLCLAHLPEG